MVESHIGEYDEELKIYTDRPIEDAPAIFREKLNEKEKEIYVNLQKPTVKEYKEVFDIFDDTGDGKISN